jgi:ABC-type methionine transport system permease subunit
LIQSKIWIVATIEGRHQSALDVTVAKTERVAELVRCDLEEIRATVTAHSPSFGVVKMRITTVNGKVSVRQGTARSIKRITVTVLTHLEPDLNMNLKES